LELAHAVVQFGRYEAPEAPGRYGTRLSVAEFCRARPRLQATPSEVLEAVTKHAWNERHGGVLRFIITGDVDPGDGTPIVEVPERPSNRLARERAQGGPGEKGEKGGYGGKGGKEKKGKGKGKEKGILLDPGPGEKGGKRGYGGKGGKEKGKERKRGILHSHNAIFVYVLMQYVTVRY